ncbi:MAG: hypothetical protein CFE25_05710 [Chitinophagaceae bacterium BSSC1]|nr:MAG: hypothetical protein CFE25_05710 [Chitinophagaceae bacterium BSSC1]
MAVENNIKAIDFIPINALVGKHFIVKDYQRGYKWDEKEINELLNDVNKHNKGRYCLQPIIVKEQNNEVELIDGQQRLTSIYLILAFLNNKLTTAFSISYETRNESKVFLLDKLLATTPFALNNVSWEELIELPDFKSYNNVDVFHFYTVYKAIAQWFNKTNSTVDKIDFINKLLNQIHVIWYDIDKAPKHNGLNSNAEDVFLKLNAGKIPLTSAELIKGLFVLQTDRQNKHSKEIAKLKITELALEWDQIESKLQYDSFWYFICDNDLYDVTETRIDFLIDLVNKRDFKKHDNLFSYRLYEGQFNSGIALNWNDIKNTFNKLNEWYNNKTLFHYIGFLITSKIKSLSSIIDLSIGTSKEIFQKKLIACITLEFKKTIEDENKQKQLKYDLEIINYSENRKECEKVLLLLNIQHYLKNSSNNRFPFELYKNDTWSVEHVNPQNPRDYNSVGEIANWLEKNGDYYQRQPNPSDAIISIIKTVQVYFENISNNDIRKLSDLKLKKDQLDKLEELIEMLSNELGLHKLPNLALLDKNTNSKLSNKLFLDKRADIVELDLNGKYTNTEGKEKLVFIPPCTKNVFTKIYTKNNSNITDSFFGKADMVAYQNFIQEQLREFYK